jgi:hypothetical protein
MVTLIGKAGPYPPLMSTSPDAFNLAQSRGLHPGASATFRLFFVVEVLAVVELEALEPPRGNGGSRVVVVGRCNELDTVDGRIRGGDVAVCDDVADKGDGGETSKSGTEIGGGRCAGAFDL